MIDLLIYFIIVCILAGLGSWVVNQFVPPPMKQWAYLVLAIIVVMIFVFLLLSVVGRGTSGGMVIHH